jgi:rubrerythrin
VGARSRAAAQILTGQGFKAVYNFKGGMKAWKGHAVGGSVKMGMTLLQGNERPAEIIRLAYGMEEALRRFYVSSAESTDDPDVSALLAQLADIETSHKDRLFGLYQSHADTPMGQDDFEADIVGNALEGGFTADAFKAKNRPMLQSTAGVLSLAMMLEAQSMDLYLRYTDMRVDPQGKTILFQLADEEKAHLLSLGALLEQKI